MISAKPWRADTLNTDGRFFAFTAIETRTVGAIIGWETVVDTITFQIIRTNAVMLASFSFNASGECMTDVWGLPAIMLSDR